MKTKLVVTGLIKNEKNEYLISQRFEPKIPDAHLKWDFPGGSIDFGETPKKALRREIMEETGLVVKVLEMVPKCYSKVWEHKDYKIHAIVLCYQCIFVEGDLHLNDRKINDLKWIKKSVFSNFDLLPSIMYFINSTSF